MSIDLSGARCFKRSRSTAGRDFVAVSHLAHSMIGVRDSKDPAGSVHGPVFAKAQRAKLSRGTTVSASATSMTALSSSGLRWIYRFGNSIVVNNSQLRCVRVQISG